LFAARVETVDTARTALSLRTAIQLDERPPMQPRLPRRCYIMAKRTTVPAGFEPTNMPRRQGGPQRLIKSEWAMRLSWAYWGRRKALLKKGTAPAPNRISRPQGNSPASNV
jgi:hypothetical protein